MLSINFTTIFLLTFNHCQVLLINFTTIFLMSSSRLPNPNFFLFYLFIRGNDEDEMEAQDFISDGQINS